MSRIRIMSTKKRNTQDLVNHFKRIEALVNKQTEDEALWLMPDSMPEAYLQQELRRLHEIIKKRVV